MKTNKEAPIMDELIEGLLAISVVAKSLAKKMMRLSPQKKGETNGKNEQPVNHD